MVYSRADCWIDLASARSHGVAARRRSFISPFPLLNDGQPPNALFPREHAPMVSSGDVEPALAALERARPGALVVYPTPVPSANVERIGALAIQLRIPSIRQAKAIVERGLLISYGADYRDVERRIPAYVDRILKGAKPADIPVERRLSSSSSST